MIDPDVDSTPQGLVDNDLITARRAILPCYYHIILALYPPVFVAFQILTKPSWCELRNSVGRWLMVQGTNV